MKVLIVSANNYGNVGDDIVAYSGAHIIKSIDPSFETVVTSPPFDESLASDADAIILSGGGIFYDRAEENVENYLQYLEYAQKHGKFNASIGIGVQGIVTDWGKGRYNQVLNKSDLVTVRSQADKRDLEKVGVKDVRATQDLGLIADDWVQRPWLTQPVLGSKPKLALVLVDVRKLIAYEKGGKIRNFIDIFEKHLPHLKEEFDIWLFAHSKDDNELRAEHAKNFGLKTVPYENIKDFPRFFEMYKKMDLVIGVRFHSIILGILARKPVIAATHEGTKQHRFATESSPTINRQLIDMYDKNSADKIFGELRERYDKGEFKTVSSTELNKIKTNVYQNVGLIKNALRKYS